MEEAEWSLLYNVQSTNAHDDTISSQISPNAVQVCGILKRSCMYGRLVKPFESIKEHTKLSVVGSTPVAAGTVYFLTLNHLTLRAMYSLTPMFAIGCTTISPNNIA